MALKAGRVGVNPSQVDMAGNIIGGGSSDSYTKAESDAKYATKTESYTKLEVDQLLGSKVGIGQLEANNKDFYFAYDSTSQKYGYKLDNEGDFHPFESAAAGLNLPDRVTTGLTFPGNLKFEEGGYQIIDGVCYFDIILKNTGGTVESGTIIENAPDCYNGSGSTCIACFGSSKSALNNFSANKITVLKDGGKDFTISGESVYQNWYVRFVAIYKAEV